ncbi:hypothetical protein Nmel_007664, partial [Mimus melanotis]
MGADVTIISYLFWPKDWKLSIISILKICSFCKNVKVWQKAINSKLYDLQLPFSLKKSIWMCPFIFSDPWQVARRRKKKEERRKKKEERRKEERRKKKEERRKKKRRKKKKKKKKKNNNNNNNNNNKNEKKEKKKGPSISSSAKFYDSKLGFIIPFHSDEGIGSSVALSLEAQTYASPGAASKHRNGHAQRTDITAEKK